ncbi:Protein of unknown function [Pyronema omphalodes CBS 100304]|uniref:Uncharacterized protein n=1 Tax=Pyronema omphalodes (strain CBS 100304) TaxID=1076935 RepID=U4L615_PYROM|nr:Protein of unknown function [Pyronema omphalodes CBS 100304]
MYISRLRLFVKRAASLIRK